MMTSTPGSAGRRVRTVAGLERRSSGSAESRGPAWTSIVEWVATIVPLGGILTALAVWFGFQIVSSRTKFFGVDPSVLGFSTGDFVLRSAAALVRPMVYLLVGVAVAIWTHQGVLWLLDNQAEAWRRSLLAAAAVTAGVGVAFVIAGIGVFEMHDLSDYSFGTDCVGGSLGRWWRPWVLPAGVVLITYANWLARHLLPGEVPGSSLWSRILAVVAMTLVLVGTFWSFSLYAHAQGALDSYGYMCGGFKQFTEVVVYSRSSLALAEEDGVDAQALGDQDAKYHWRYTGLRLLIHSQDRFFMVPQGWSGRGDAVIMLTDSPDLRFEFSSPELL